MWGPLASNPTPAIYATKYECCGPRTHVHDVCDVCGRPAPGGRGLDPKHGERLGEEGWGTAWNGALSDCLQGWSPGARAERKKARGRKINSNSVKENNDDEATTCLYVHMYSYVSVWGKIRMCTL